ncbi:MAG TPA: choline kinase, partial [Bacteroidales bacterium]|nr:choline kinase [Bacteroidales bacterium]
MEILRSCGYTNIVVIVGYKRELFEPYQSEDVHIVFNPDYEFCASMGSLVMAAPYINEDFLIIEGDTFYEKKIVETLTNTSEPNCLIVTEETGSGDECYVETQHGFLKQITKDKHAVPCIEGELVGVAKISLSVFRRMISLYRESSNSYMNYEYVLMRSTTIVERPCIRFQNLIWGDVDTQEDLKRLQQTYRILQRKENPFNEENLRQYLSPIFTS